MWQKQHKILDSNLNELQSCKYWIKNGTIQGWNDISKTWEPNFEIKKFAKKVKQILSILTGIPIEDFEKEEVKNRHLGEEWNRWILEVPKDYNSFKPYRYPKLFTSEKEAWEFNENELGHENSICSVCEEKITVRQAMQLVGTDLFRDKFHPDTWVNALMNDYTFIPDQYPSPEDDYEDRLSNGNYPNWIVTDVRFPNEAQAIKNRGGIIIRINRVTGNCLLDNDTHAVTDWQHSSETDLDNYTFDFTIVNNGSIENLIEKVKKILIELKLI